MEVEEPHAIPEKPFAYTEQEKEVAKGRGSVSSIVPLPFELPCLPTHHCSSRVALDRGCRLRSRWSFRLVKRDYGLEMSICYYCLGFLIASTTLEVHDHASWYLFSMILEQCLEAHRVVIWSRFLPPETRRERQSELHPMQYSMIMMSHRLRCW